MGPGTGNVRQKKHGFKEKCYPLFLPVPNVLPEWPPVPGAPRAAH